MALKYDVHSIDAIVGITEILVDKKEHGEAIKILEGELESGRHRELIHTRLAEVYHLDNAHANALEHYNAALRFFFFYFFFEYIYCFKLLRRKIAEFVIWIIHCTHYFYFTLPYICS